MIVLSVLSIFQLPADFYVKKLQKNTACYWFVTGIFMVFAVLCILNNTCKINHSNVLISNATY